VTGRTCVITGATSGIGRAAAESLAAKGARLVIVARDSERGARARHEIVSATGNQAVRAEICDLASQRQIRELADRLLATEGVLHVLVNNAGLTMARHTLTEDGREYTFAVNHLAPFLLTGLLLDRLVDSAPSRVVTVSSDAHHGAQIPFDNLDGERGYSAWSVYGWTKLANVLFTRELARRTADTNVTATCLHPGVVATGFGRTAPMVISLFQKVARPLLLDARRGADTLVWLASSPDVEGESGGYYVRRMLKEPSAAARDDATARRLWKVSARLTGLA
jgi:NAD(P)-dependent dehydrogenase (short-subunit alcohol dehydrogenase family)